MWHPRYASQSPGLVKVGVPEYKEGKGRPYRTQPTEQGGTGLGRARLGKTCKPPH